MLWNLCINNLGSPLIMAHHVDKVYSVTCVMTLVCADIGTLTQWYLVFGARASEGNKDEITGTGWRHTKKLTQLFCGFLSVSWRLLLSLHCSFILLYLMELSRISCWVSWKCECSSFCDTFGLPLFMYHNIWTLVNLATWCCILT